MTEQELADKIIAKIFEDPEIEAQMDAMVEKAILGILERLPSLWAQWDDK